MTSATKSAARSRLGKKRLSIPHVESNQYPFHVILFAGFKVVGRNLRALAPPASFLRLLFHFGIGYYFFSHYVASLRPTLGSSMLPTLHVSGDTAVVCWLYSHGHGIKAGDLISYQHPIIRGAYNIKRVVGMEGDYILRDTPGGLNGQLAQLGDIEGYAHEDSQGADANPKDQILVKIPKGHCWVVGDNLSWSLDSRMYGPIPLALVRGKAIAIKKPGWPWQGWSLVGDGLY